MITSFPTPHKTFPTLPYIFITLSRWALNYRHSKTRRHEEAWTNKVTRVEHEWNVHHRSNVIIYIYVYRLESRVIELWTKDTITECDSREKI